MENCLSKTALAVACFMQNTGIQHCQEISAYTRAAQITQGVLGEHFGWIIELATMKVKLRHLALTSAIRATGFKRLLEVACGLDPRGFILTDFAVVDTDLSPIVELKNNIASVLIPDHPNYRVREADATYAEDLLSASQLLPPGPITISIAGFLTYLPMSIKHLAMQAVTSVMDSRPGSVLLVTSEDFLTRTELDTWNETPKGRILLEKIPEMAGQSSRIFYNNAFPDEDAVPKFLHMHSLDFCHNRQIDLVQDFQHGITGADAKKFSAAKIWEMRRAW